MRSVAKLVFGSGLIACLCVLQKEAKAQSKATLFEGATLITGDSTGPIENSVFLLRNGKFVEVGKKGEIKLPKGATRVDLTGKTVMPGIVRTAGAR